MRDNPCKSCDKATIDMICNLEYGCCDPCQEAEDFFADVGKKIDELLKRANQLLKGGAE